jgi:hypothetical protein
VAAARLLEPSGLVILAPNARPEIKEVKKVAPEKEKNLAPGDTDSAVARQNQLNELEQAQGECLKQGCQIFSCTIYQNE